MKIFCEFLENEDCQCKYRMNIACEYAVSLFEAFCRRGFGHSSPLTQRYSRQDASFVLASNSSRYSGVAVNPSGEAVSERDHEKPRIRKKSTGEFA